MKIANRWQSSERWGALPNNRSLHLITLSSGLLKLIEPNGHGVRWCTVVSSPVEPFGSELWSLWVAVRLHCHTLIALIALFRIVCQENLSWRDSLCSFHCSSYLSSHCRSHCRSHWSSQCSSQLHLPMHLPLQIPLQFALWHHRIVWLNGIKRHRNAPKVSKASKAPKASKGDQFQLGTPKQPSPRLKCCLNYIKLFLNTHTITQTNKMQSRPLNSCSAQMVQMVQTWQWSPVITQRVHRAFIWALTECSQSVHGPLTDSLQIHYRFGTTSRYRFSTTSKRPSSSILTADS